MKGRSLPFQGLSSKIRFSILLCWSFCASFLLSAPPSTPSLPLHLSTPDPPSLHPSPVHLLTHSPDPPSLSSAILSFPSLLPHALSLSDPPSLHPSPVHLPVPTHLTLPLFLQPFSPSLPSFLMLSPLLTPLHSIPLLSISLPTDLTLPPTLSSAILSFPSLSPHPLVHS